MSVPSKRRVRAELKALRGIIEDENRSPAEQRIAYAVECAIRWVVEDTTSWVPPAESVASDAALLMKEACR